MLNRRSALFGTLLAMTLAAPTLAHEVKNGPNGGRVADAGAHHVELVVKGDAVDVFITDHSDKAVPPTGFKAVAILAVSGKSQRVTLAPDGARLSGRMTAAAGGQPKGVVQLTGPDGKTAQARFN